MRYVTDRGWSPFEAASELLVDGRKTSLHFRAEARTAIYVSEEADFAGEVLAGIGEGDLEVAVIGYGPLYVRAESEGRVWLRRSEIDQLTVAVHGSVFTEPVMPRTVAPELQALQLTIRKMELERKHEREEQTRAIEQLRRRIDDAPELAGVSRGTVGRASGHRGSVEETRSEDDLGSAEDAPEPQRSSIESGADGVAAGSGAGRPDRRKSREGSPSAADTADGEGDRAG